MEVEEENVYIHSDFSMEETIHVLGQLLLQMNEGVTTTPELQYVPYHQREKTAIISRGKTTKYFVMTNLTKEDLETLLKAVHHD
ncbi:MAG: hypothetical protein QW750_06280 [Zestosphaera sp.]